MFPTRRDFLRNSSLIAWGLSVPGFLGRTAHAAPTADQKGAKDTILVVVQLTGGNDGLNTVVPHADPNYAKLRPTLKLSAAQLKKIDDSTGLHPSMDGLASLLENQQLCIVQGVGYPNPTQSHFDSMDIWQAGTTAALKEKVAEGWVGKALKGMPAAPSFHLAASNEEAPKALAGAPVRVPSITSLEDFQLKTAAASGRDARDQKDIIEGSAQGATSGKPNLLDFVQRTALDTYASSKRLQELGKNYQPKVPYPNTPLANRLKLAAQLIDANIGARVFYVSQGGYDTHANQLTAHAALLKALSDAITAFTKDLSARGHKDRLLVMTFSEFGRRPYENSSKGTDHGAAAPMLLIGNKVKAGLVGQQPSLSEADFGNLKHHTDFRQVYATVLDQWLGVASKDVLGQEFKGVELFKG
jgi:uncharacterized protein (DUF1501 family)